MSTGQRLALAAFIVGGLVLAAPNVALAHSPDVVPNSRCLDAGGWEATVTIWFSQPGPTISGTTTSSDPPGTSVAWVLAPEQSQTFGTGVTIPLTVPSVTFTVVGSWADGTPVNVSKTAFRPDGCTPTTTTTTTTTTLPTDTTTTTTLPGDLSITAITPICVADAPYVQVTFGNQPAFNGRPATVTFIDINGLVVAMHTATYVANGSVTFVYPGATVDAAGNATDWPGWRFDGDEWVPDLTDTHLRDGLTVRVEVNPTATGQVSYPPANSACASPQQGVGGAQGGSPQADGDGADDSSALPVTGATTGPTAAVAAAAVAFGAVAMVLARRGTSRRP